MTTRVAILISGGGSNMVALARSMTGDHPGRCVLVLSNQSDAGGLQKAEAMGLPTAVIRHQDYESRAAFEDAIHARLVAADVDIVCLAGFMRVLGAEFVARWEGRMLNIHPSLLPKYKGLQTHQRALAAGDSVHGCTVHLVTPDLDDGPVLGQLECPVAPDDTAETLAARVLPLEHQLYPAMLRRFIETDPK